VNKTVEHIVENLGNIKRLTVAALVNGVPTTVTKDGQKVTEMQPRPEQEMRQLNDLVRRAVGYNPVRSDEVSVTNLTFGTHVPEQEFVYRSSPLANWTDYKEEIFLGLAMLGTLMVLWSLLSRFRTRIELPTFATDVPSLASQLESKKPIIELPNPEEEISTDVLLRNERRKRIGEYIREKPSDSARLLKVWLTEE
jgi:flagellar M-ring protein FliF